MEKDFVVSARWIKRVNDVGNSESFPQFLSRLYDFMITPKYRKCVTSGKWVTIIGTTSDVVRIDREGVTSCEVVVPKNLMGELDRIWTLLLSGAGPVVYSTRHAEPDAQTYRRLVVSLEHQYVNKEGTPEEVSFLRFCIPYTDYPILSGSPEGKA